MFHTEFDRFDEPFPRGTLSPNPQIIGHFSVDGTGNLTFDISQKRYLKQPKGSEGINYDLNEGYIDITEEPESKKGNINYLLRWLKWIKGHSGQEVLYDRVPESEITDRQVPITDDELKGIFVCRQRFLTKLISTPFEEREGWKMAVMVHKGSIYMCQVEGNTVPDQNAGEDLWRRSCFWGWKLAQLLTADGPDGNPAPTRPCNLLEEFNTVNKLHTQNHTIVYNCNMVAFNNENETFVDIKTCKKPTDERQKKNFTRFKLQKWWAQSQLGGVSGVLVGYRDDNGIVTSLEFMKTIDLIKRGRRWKDNVCYHFLEEFLKWLKEVIKSKTRRSSTQKVRMFEYFPNDKEIRLSLSSDDDEQFNFLPTWYTEE